MYVHIPRPPNAEQVVGARSRIDGDWKQRIRCHGCFGDVAGSIASDSFGLRCHTRLGKRQCFEML